MKNKNELTYAYILLKHYKGETALFRDLTITRTFDNLCNYILSLKNNIFFCPNKGDYELHVFDRKHIEKIQDVYEDILNIKYMLYINHCMDYDTHKYSSYCFMHSMENGSKIDIDIDLVFNEFFMYGDKLDSASTLVRDIRQNNNLKTINKLELSLEQLVYLVEVSGTNNRYLDKLYKNKVYYRRFIRAYKTIIRELTKR